MLTAGVEKQVSFWSFLRGMFRGRSRRDSFTLGKRGKPGIPGAGEDVVDGRRVGHGKGARSAAERSPFGGMSEAERRILESRLDRSLDRNLAAIREVFHAPKNSDLVTREILLRCRRGRTRVAVIFLQGLADVSEIRSGILRPLVRLNISRRPVEVSVKDAASSLIPEIQVRIVDSFSPVVAGIAEGETALLVDGDAEALIADTRGVEHRAIEESPAEAVVRGPHSGFVEDYRTNVSLVRLYLQTPQLVTETLHVGARSHVPVAIMYLEGVANPKLVSEVKRRIGSIRADYVSLVAMIERYIEDRPFEPFPSLLTTERPDRVAALISEGHVAILASCPTAGVAPVTLWDLMHSPEDYYIHFLSASFLRLTRWLALFATLYAASLYVALVDYHPEMIPTELLFAIAAARERVPFPAAVEVLLMEVAFELIREAGIRIPSIIGPTIGIVGAVILGQAAVQATLVSPILVVVIAISSLGSFAVPDYSIALVLRMLKFVMILTAAFMGIPGLVFMNVLLLTRLCAMKSFGVPVTAPLFPYWKHAPDTLIRGPLWAMERRPGQVAPLDQDRQAKDTRALEPGEAGGHEGPHGGARRR